MAKGTKKSPLQERIEAENARESIRYEKPKGPGGGTLPAGINNGIAKLTRVDFDVIAEGKYKGSQRSYVHGTCVSPVEHEGRKVKGCLVQLGTIVLNDTAPDDGKPGVPKSFTENLSKAENRLKLLGFPTDKFDDDSLEGDVLGYFEDNKEEMYFTFRTWESKDDDGKPDGRVLTTLVGVAENYVPDDDEGVDDETEVKPVSKKASAKATTKVTKSTPTTKKLSTKKVVEEDEAPFEADDDNNDDDEPVDLKVLAKKADKGDKSAQLAITAEAKKVKINPEAEEYDDWDDVAMAVMQALKKQGTKKAVEPEPEAEDDEQEDVVPEKGEVYNFKVGKKLLECEVIKVLKRTQTVSLKSLSDDDEFEEVSWSKLIEIKN